MQQGVVSNWGTAFFVLFLLIPCVIFILATEGYSVNAPIKYNGI